MSRDALIVGINSYLHLPGLQAPARDAEAIAHLLETQGEFRVRRLPEVIQSGQPQIGQQTKVTLRELETALVNLFKPKGNTIPQTAVFYFSGHGIQKDAGIQEGYLAVSDTHPDMGFYGLSLFWLRRLLQESPVRQRIIWLDCCHSGELLNFLEADPGARPGTDRLFMAASREYESAYESLDSPYSVFTQALVTGLDPQRLATGIVTNHSLIDWVSHSLKAELQQPLFESSGSEIILTRSTQSPSATKPVKTSDICPYRGLEFFDEAHAEYFFGREDLTDQLLEKLRKKHFLAVVGASGSGKSSVVRAGLISELRRGQKFSGSDRWQIKLLTPTEHPLKSLTSAFIDADLSSIDRAEQLRRAESFLQTGGTGLAQLVRASLPNTSSSTGLGAHLRPRMLLVIDQFEEVFTLCHSPEAEQERQQFFDCLFGALQTAPDYLSVVIVLRADFFSKCSLYETLAHQIEDNLVMVTPLSYEQIKATIVRPAQKVGLVCEPNLIYTMLLDIIGAPGELPLLQYTLLELWQRRQVDPDGAARLTLDTYTQLGGVRGTLQKRATEIFYSLTSDEQAVAKRIFLALTQLGEGTEDTRRRVSKSELVSPAFPTDLIDRALEKLVYAKLVVTSQEREVDAEPDEPKPWQDLKLTKSYAASSCRLPACQETIDVAHEALIRNWSLLRSWLDEDREKLRRQRQIERAAQEWHNLGQPIATDYLLRGSRLINAEDFTSTYPDELSDLAQHYLTVSQTESRRTHRELRLLKISIPSVLLIALIATFNQYHNVLKTKAEKEQQLRIATSRERAAIAQAILQEPSGDPMAALLISRLAVEQNSTTSEAQSSLRAVLQGLHLQLELQNQNQVVNQIAFSPNQQYLAAATADGTIQLWSMGRHTVHVGHWAPDQTLTWADSNQKPANIRNLTFNADGTLVAAIANDSPIVTIWSVADGKQVAQLNLPHPVTQMAFSPKANWLAVTSRDRTLSIWQADTGKLQTRLPLSATTTSLQFNPTGTQLLTSGTNGSVQVWQLMPSPTRLQAKPTVVLNHAGAVGQATFSPSGRWIATACDDGQARLWDATTGQLQQSFVQQAQMEGESSEAAYQRNNQTGRSNQVKPAIANVQPVTQVAFSPNERLLAVTHPNQTIWLWDVQQGQLQAELTPSYESSNLQYAGLEPIAFSPDSRLILAANHNQPTADGSHTVRVWDTQTGNLAASLTGHIGAVQSATFSPDGMYIVTADDSGAIRLWSALAAGELPSLKPQDAWVQWAGFVSATATHADPTDAAPQAHAANLMTIATNGTFDRWTLVDHTSAPSVVVPKDSQEHPSFIHTLSIQPQNLWRAMQALVRRSPSIPSSPEPSQVSPPEGQLSGEATERSPQTAASLGTSFLSTPSILTGAAFSPNGQLIARAKLSGSVEIWKISANSIPQLVHQIPIAAREGNQSPTGAPRQLSFSATNQLLLGVGDDATVQIWDAVSGQPLQVLRSDRSPIQQAQFSSDSRWIVTTNADQTVKIWDVGSGQLLKTLPQLHQVNSARFNSAGTQLVIASGDGTASVIDSKTGQLQVILTGHRGALLDAQFSPDGRSIVTASKDGTARLWNAQTGVEQAQLRPGSFQQDPGAVLHAFFSPDGDYVATLAEDGRIYLWAANWNRLSKLARDRSLRQLTSEECIHYLRLPPNACPLLGTAKS